jgi:hypothetical protein
MSRYALFCAAKAADNAWMSEIARVFGVKDAGRARIQGRASGEPGSHLRALYDQSETARIAYQAVRGRA